MRHLRLVPSVILLALIAACAPDPKEVSAADLILTNARVYTLDCPSPAPMARLHLMHRMPMRDGTRTPKR